MKQYFEINVTSNGIDESGKDKKTSRRFFIDAISWTEAEARIYKEFEQMSGCDFVIKSISKSNVVDVFYYEGSEMFFRVVISMIILDEGKGKEKKANENYLVQADDLEQALNRTQERLTSMLVPYSIKSIMETSIEDVFEYESENDEN